MRRHFFFSHASIIIQFSRHRAEISPLSTRQRLMEHDKTYFLDTVRLKSCYASEKDSNLKQGESISFYCMSIPSSLRIDIGMQPPLLIISHDIIALMDRQSKAIQAF